MSQPIYKAGEKFRRQIVRQESSFDRACETAYQLALMQFGADDCGYLNNVIDSERSTDSIMVEFVSYCHLASMTGHSHVYTFDLSVERYVDDEEG